MTPVLRFVAVSWSFLWRQPALQQAAAVLLFLPLAASYYLSSLAFDLTAEQIAILVVVAIALTALLAWGVACTLTVGKRLLQAKSGRLRTSFKAVQGQARGLVVTMVLTEVLRFCIAVLWSLPLIGLLAVMLMISDGMLPSAIVRAHPWFLPLAVALALLPAVYLLRTVLVPLVVAYEKTGFRDALARSSTLTTPRLGRTLLVAAVLALLWVPGLVTEALFALYADPTLAFYTSPAVSAGFDTVAIALYYLTLTQFYKALGGKAKAAANDE